ncbi:MAG: sel1 repeat family protein [Prevotellaceae bacterium]|nr:sel1 repeat family protein [Prevotellaceae bacterium]
MNSKERINELIINANAGNAGAQNGLACAYYNGDGIDKNIPLALNLFEVAATSGDMYAQSNLAYRYRYGTDGYTKDLRKAFELYEKSAMQGNASAQESLGIFYAFGYGTPCNNVKAAEWYRKAAVAGKSMAQNNLGTKYEHGQGVEKNYIIALNWYMKAARQGNAYAQCNLGILYEEGKGTDKNLKQALCWYKKSVGNDHDRAKRRINDLLKVYDTNTDKNIFNVPVFVDNPFRILGVYTNATAREITANKSKAMAFAKIGKTVAFTTDSIIQNMYKRTYPRSGQISLFDDFFDDLADTSMSTDELYIEIKKLEDENEHSSREDNDESRIHSLYDAYERGVKRLYSVKRDEESMNAAVAAISQPRDKIKYALFWFIKISPLDEKALECIMHSELKRAYEMWEEEESFSSLVNAAVCAFIMEDDENLVYYMTRMIHDDDYREAFISAVCGENCNISEEELAHIFIDELLQDMPVSGDWRYWIDIFSRYGASGEDDDYLRSRLVHIPADVLANEIARVKNISRSKGTERYRAALTLRELASLNLDDIADVAGKDSLPYQSIADKVAQEILNCAMDYYKECSRTVYQATGQCVELNQYAYDIAVGAAVRVKLLDSLTEIKDRLSKLPPEKAFVHFSKINKLLDNFYKQPNLVVHSEKLLNDCVPFLREVKQMLGRDNKTYINISTQIASNAMINVISELNKKLDDLERDAALHHFYSTKRREYAATLRRAWQIIINIGELDVSKDFKEKEYLPNRDTINKNCLNCNVSVAGSPTIDMQTEEEYYSKCTSVDNYTKYLLDYPQGMYCKQAKEQIDKHNKKDDEYWVRCKEIEAYSQYLEKYKKGRHVQEATSAIEQQERAEEEEYWRLCCNNKVYSAYLERYRNGFFAEEAYNLDRKMQKKAVLTIIALVIFIIFTAIILTLIIND